MSAVKRITLTQGKTAIVDDIDAGIAKTKWFYNNGYAGRHYGPKKARKLQLMHTLITELEHGPRPKGYVVDHINQNTLDNRRGNLRWASRSQNMLNRTFNPAPRKYQVRVMGKAYYFKTIDEANKFRAKMVKSIAPSTTIRKR